MNRQQESIEHYVTAIQDCVLKVERGEQPPQRLLEFIEGQMKDEAAQEPRLQHFFQGEHAFYKGDHEQALRNYLQASGIPHFQFFCYRASAFVAKKMGKHEKAVTLAKKALTVNPNDFITLKMLSDELNSALTSEDSTAIKQKIQELQIPLKHNLELDTHQKISLGSKEIDELAQIFQDNPSGQQALFELEEKIPRQIKSETQTSQLPSLQRTESFKDQSHGIHELKKLANSDFKIEVDSTARFIKEGLGMDVEAGLMLEQKVKAFEKTRTELIKGYMEQGRKRSVHDHSLHVLNGWSTPTFDRKASQAVPNLLSEDLSKASGGFFLRWNGTGIVINPGANFLEHFHRSSLHIRDIDHVIVTRDAKDAYADLKGIYDLNYQLNNSGTELHIIHYHMHQNAFQDIGRALKPHFKQERHTVHSLELYVDSSESEKIELSEGIFLCYFAATAPSTDAFGTKQPNSLGIRLELKPSGTAYHKETVHLGYISGSPWSPILKDQLKPCDILIAGFENTGAEDFRKLKYRDDCLGYYGNFTLAEEIGPKLLLCCEFGKNAGDIRIEAIKKLRQDHATQTRTKKTSTQILPGDIGLYIDLKAMLVQCSISKTLVDPALIKVMRPAEAFGQLQYLSPACIL